MTVRELVTKLGFEVDDEQAKQFDSRVEGMKKRMGQVAKIAGAATATAVVLIGKAAISAAADMEMLTTQFEVMLGSSDKAIAMMDELKTFAASTPFALNDLSKGTQNLLAFGVAEEEVIGAMQMLGDTAGGNAEKLDGLVLAYGKTMAKGKAQAEELNMMTERGIPILGTLAEKYNTTKQGILDMASKSKISAEDIKDAFKTMTSEGGMFFEGMKKQSLTFDGMMSTLKDNVTMVLADVGGLLLPVLKEVMGTLTLLLQGALGDALKALLDPLLGMVTNIFPILVQVIEMLVPIFEMLGGVIEKIAPIMEKILAFLMPIIQIIINLLMPVLELISPILDLVLALLGPILDLVNAILLPILDMVGLMSGDVVSVINSLVKDLMYILTGILIPIMGVLTKIIGFVMEVYSKYLRGIMKIILTILSILFSVYVFIYTKIFQVIVFIFQWLFEKIYSIYEFAVGLFSAFWEWLIGKFPIIGTIAGKIGEVFLAVWDTIKNAFSSMWDWIIAKLDKLFGILNKIPGVDIPGIGMPSMDATGARKNIGEAMMKLYGPQGGTTAETGGPMTGANTPASRMANVNMDNKIEVNVPPGSNVGAIKGAVEEAAKAAFSVELQRVLVDAGY